MKQKLTLILALSLLATSAFSQTKTGMKGDKKGPLFGIHFNMQDFNAPLGIKNPSTGIGYSNFKDMNRGFSLSFWKGIHPKIDFALKANTSFRDYRAKRAGLTNKTEFGIELEPSLNVRPFSDAALLNPFLTIGIGGGLYTDQLGAYIPAGAGLQINFNSVTYLFVQAQYRWDILEKESKVGDNLFYSLGIAQNIGKEKPKVVPPPPPPPLPPPPPDRDGDGVLDVDDKCPDVAGLASLQGCPDRDGDGITDLEDKCPDVPGLARYQGCPIPDTDGDGVNDEEDKCINEKGPASNFGCPIIDVAIIERVKLAAKNVFFATASDKLLAQSNKRLNDVVTILNENPSFKIQIDGHTDSQGKDDYNMDLSDRRAASVKAYLVSKGIAESRLNSKGYGETTPVADNNTAKGRAQNRRVEMTLSNY